MLLIPVTILAKYFYRWRKILYDKHEQKRKAIREQQRQEEQRKRIAIEQAKAEQESIDEIIETNEHTKYIDDDKTEIEEKQEPENQQKTQPEDTPKEKEEKDKDKDKNTKSYEKKQPLLINYAKEEERKIEQIKAIAIRIKQRDTKSYEKKLIEWLAEFPQSIELMSLLADYYIEWKNYKKASTILKTIINQDPENHRALRQLAEIYMEEGERQNAQIMLEKAIRLQKDNPKYLYSMVDIQYNSGNIDDALFLMEKILKLRPINSEYLIATAMLYEEKWEIQIAKKYYFEVLEHEPDNRTAKIKLKNI